MWLKSNLVKLWQILEKLFFIPFSLIAFLIFAFVGVLEIQVPLINSTQILYTGLFFGFITSLFVLKNTKEDSHLYKIILIIFTKTFLASLILIIAISLLSFLEIESSIIDTFYLLANSSIATSAFIILFLKRKIIGVVVEQILNERDEVDNKKSSDFALKFPNISKIPVLNDITGWLFCNGYFYIFVASALLTVGFLIRIHNLGDLGLWWDELITGTYVTRILETGLPLFPSELGYYWRGVAYHYIVAAFAFLFGSTEFIIRLPSVLFGMGSILIVFYYAKKIDKGTALLILLFLVFSSYDIEYSRFARFYVMNAFLFVLSIIIFYKGFFENKLKYKIISVLVFSVMLHTVQAGLVFISLIVAWLLSELRKINFISNNLINTRQTLVKLLWIPVFLIVFKLDNVFNKLYQIENSGLSEPDISMINTPRSWEYFSFPNFEFFKFFNEHYLPVGLIFTSFFVILFTFFYSSKQKQVNFFTFAGLSLIVSIFAYEIGSRGVYGPRLYLFAEALIVFFVFTSLFVLLRICLIKQKMIYGLIGTATVFIIMSIHPNFYERITINYGESVSSDPFRTTEVAAYRSDYKGSFTYLSKELKEKDILIVVMGSNYYNLRALPDYVFNQGLRWNTSSLVDSYGNFITPDTGSVLINKVSDIENIIATNQTRRVYLLVNGGSINILFTRHVNEDFISFLNQNQDKEVYRSPDMYSKVLLFNP